MILIFGKNGQLAQSFRATIPSSLDGKTVFVSSHEANFTEPNLLPGFLDKYSPEIVIICAAYTQVDQAEQEQHIAEDINFRAPQEIARWCGKNGSHLIHFSTDYVYSGEGDQPWNENAKPHPQNWYGETKLKGDEAIQHSGCKHFIFRTSWVYSEYGKNFLKTMLRAGKDKSQLRVVSDQVGSPSYAPELAEKVWNIVLRLQNGEKFPSGIYHLAGQGETSWHGFAENIFQQAKDLKYKLMIENVESIPTKDYPTPAHRPLNSRLDLTKFSKVFGITTVPWQESVQLCLRRIGP